MRRVTHAQVARRAAHEAAAAADVALPYAEASSAQDKSLLAALKALMIQVDSLQGQVYDIKRELKKLHSARPAGSD